LVLFYIFSLKLEVKFIAELELLISNYFQTWVCGPGSTSPSSGRLTNVSMP
jgi:hypothetical protein